MTDRRFGRLLRWGAVAATSAVCAWVWVALRLVGGPFSVALPTFFGFCNRLRESGIQMTPDDRLCFPSFWVGWRSNMSLTSLLAVSGVCLACIVLAATGRRLSALAPLLPVILPGQSLFFARTDISVVGVSPVFGAEPRLVASLLLVIPVMAVIIACRRAPPERLRAPPSAWIRATVALAVVSLLGWWSLRLSVWGLHGYWADNPWLSWSGVCVVLLGALLGRDRRSWWWSLAPVAVLVSWGPSQWVSIPIETSNRPRGTVLFGFVLPLFLLGLLWTTWRPLIERLRDGRAATAGPRDERRFRPIVVPKALAVGLVLVSVIAARNDTLTIAWDQSVPTYEGARERAGDVWVRTNLREGLAAMDEYRAQRGTYEGFRASDGSSIAPSVPWSDPPAASGGQPRGSVVTVLANPASARLVTFDRYGQAWCIQEEQGRITYGGSDPASVAARGDTGPEKDLVASESAVHNCGDLPWTAHATAAPPLPECSEAYAYLLCRMTQVLMHNELSRTADGPETFGYVFEGRLRLDVPVGWHAEERTVGGSVVSEIWTGGGEGELSVSIVDEGVTDGEPSTYTVWPGSGLTALLHESGWVTTRTTAVVVGGRSYELTITSGPGVTEGDRSLAVRMLEQMKAVEMSPGTVSPTPEPSG